MAMQWRNDGARYGAVSVVMHWLGAIAIIAMLGTAGWIVAAPNEETEGGRIQLHAFVGATLYAIIAVRILWSWIERKPAPLSGTAAEKSLARFVHSALQILIAFQLVTGPLNVWSGGWPVAAFGLFSVPTPFNGPQTCYDAIGEMHRYSGFAIVLLLCLHLAGVLKHVLVARDGTFSRVLRLDGRTAKACFPSASEDGPEAAVT